MERMGINGQLSGQLNGEITDYYSGHIGDPFKTLSRIFP
jgi:hypothetical protein